MEVILCTLHAGGNSPARITSSAAALHRVGVSVVNALSSALEVVIRRDGQVYRMTFAGGDKQTDLEVIDTCGKRNTGTAVTFQPDPRYFDSITFSVPACATCCGPSRAVPRPAGQIPPRKNPARPMSGITRTASPTTWRTPPSTTR